VPDLPLAAAPNAGWPEHRDSGRVFYPATPSYFGHYARAFVEAGAQAGRRLLRHHRGPHRRHAPGAGYAGGEQPAVTCPGAGDGACGAPGRFGADQQLSENLRDGRFIITVEMSPPKGIATERLLEGARTLKAAGANFLDIADSPLARMRMSAWAAAYLVQREVGLETILHFPTRGRNLLRVQGDLLAAHAMGIRNLFVTMGDPTKIGDYPEAMDSYDIVPTGLIQLIKEQFNSGLDKAGKAIDQATSFVVGCALSLTPADPEREIKLLQKKVRMGADFALTQPVFDPAAARRLSSSIRRRRVKRFCPWWPASSRSTTAATPNFCTTRCRASSSPTPTGSAWPRPPIRSRKEC
jgi:methionine synthase / methylenetetrahydrofolate reductase(NADPH)